MNRGEHFAACADYGVTIGATCRGCVPSEAREGALICGRCYAAVKRNVVAAPDVIALIRSQADPLKAAVYDREMVTGSRGDSAPAPVQSDLIDAADDIIRTLRGWSYYAAVGEFTSRVAGLAPGADAEEAHDAALDETWAILASLDGLANDAGQVQALCTAFIDLPPAEHSGVWTIERAIRRWPLADRAYYAAQPCPVYACGIRAIRVTPPRRAGGDTRYLCAACGWEKHDYDDDGLWLNFSKKEGKAA
ncbi:hypothetical protein QN354_09490 [Cryobacterium sp. 5I3]|uniref:hypothetical protein n=1 Tax=Cryobacterium sp. 5I3 TaxID=3048592 RepID=UPI002B22B09C|nr:hypothetical protein [Cryobacterium sp. 5I3]MEB0201988.1 hypothetical protein [Cryobacterium sp. 5I3]